MAAQPVTNPIVPETRLPSLEDSIKELGERIKDPSSDLPAEELPGLDKLIDDWYDEKTYVSEEAFARRILQVFQNSNHNEVYKDVVDKLPSEVHKTTLEDFVSGRITAEDAGKALALEAPTVQTHTEELLSEAAPLMSSTLSLSKQVNTSETKKIRVSLAFTHFMVRI